MKDITKSLRICSFQDYKDKYQNSVEDPEKFWSNIAENFYWRKPWDIVLDWDFTEPKVKWFSGGKLNITENALDQHVKDFGDRTAIIWEPNDPNEKEQYITYQELYTRVCQFANVLKQQGVKKGDRVCIYMPMIPQLAVAMLACARIGAIHSIVFAGFSSKALASRIEDSACSILITSNEMYRGNKTINVKEICDQALTECPTITTCIVYQRTSANVEMKEGRDVFWDDEMKKVDAQCDAEIMDAEDVLFVLYTSGSTGKPKGMVHTCGGYMVYTAYTFINVFNYTPGEVYWCTADIGWITGHSYIIYGPLVAGSTTVMFEGIPSYPDYGRFWDIVDKYQVNQFYTAPTAIRALARQNISYVNSHSLESLQVLGTVGEPINEEAWNWYNENIGKGRCPIVDTWWQTETGGIMISPLSDLTPSRPTFATLPLPGVQPVLMDMDGKEIPNSTNPAEGRLCIKFPWPSIARTIWGDHARYKEVYFSTFPGYYFSGDGALRDQDGLYRITGRVDDVIIVSGHNLGTAPIENAINEYESIAESAIVGFSHDIKGNALYAFVVLHEGHEGNDDMRNEIKNQIANSIGPISKPDKIQFVPGLPKTRSGKIMRRILRKVANQDSDNLGDISTLLNPEVVESIILGYIK